LAADLDVFYAETVGRLAERRVRRALVRLQSLVRGCLHLPLELVYRDATPERQPYRRLNSVEVLGFCEA